MRRDFRPRLPLVASVTCPKHPYSASGVLPAIATPAARRRHVAALASCAHAQGRILFRFPCARARLPALRRRWKIRSGEKAMSLEMEQVRNSPETCSSVATLCCRTSSWHRHCRHPAWPAVASLPWKPCNGEVETAAAALATAITHTAVSLATATGSPTTVSISIRRWQQRVNSRKSPWQQQRSGRSQTDAVAPDDDCCVQ